MKTKSLFEELIEDLAQDKKIVKSLKPKDHLCEKIFKLNDGEYFVKDEIRTKLLEITNSFMEFLGVEFFIHDVVLTGSLVNYNWSEYSDLDLHILIDFEDAKYDYKLLKEFFDAKEKVWKEKHNIKIKGHDVEIYPQDTNEKHISSGVYSILNNEWIVKPEKSKPNIDDRKIIEKGEEYGKQIDLLLNDFNDGKDVEKVVSTLYKKIKTFRQSGLESGGEYSYENLTFKLLRRNGYIGKLLDLKTKVIDNKLSVRQ